MILEKAERWHVIFLKYSNNTDYKISVLKSNYAQNKYKLNSSFLLSHLTIMFYSGHQGSTCMPIYVQHDSSLLLDNKKEKLESN